MVNKKRPIIRRAPRCIAIEKQYDFTGTTNKTPQQGDLFRSERRAHRRYDVLSSIYMQRDDVEVSFDHDSGFAAAHGFARQMQTIKRLAFVKYW